jgi:methylenetetrahydrofolate reductase (NADPH)
MSPQAATLQQRIDGGKRILIAEVSPPQGGDPAPLRQTAQRYAGKVHAVGISDNRDRVSMSALAAACVVAGEGIEPILHVTTRDRNRIALVSEALGAQALGIRNLLCTSGSHQTLGAFRAAKNVYDLDAVQLLQTYAALAGDGAAVGEPGGIAGAGPFCLGAVAAPDADPLELQVARLVKKTRAGARFMITQPVYDWERFRAWWEEVTRHGIHEKIAILAGIQPLAGGHLADVQAGRRPQPRIPEAVLQRVASKSGPAAQRAEAVAVAIETARRLCELDGVRGLSVSVDGDADAALEVLEKSGLGSA